MKYVIIGNSAAGVGAVEGIRRLDGEGEIIVISNEPHHTYSRPLISYLLLGKTDEERMKYRGSDFYEKNAVKFIHADAARIDAEQRNVFLSDGEQIPYDKLLIATGSSPFTPPFEGLGDVDDKFNFMCLDDAKAIEELLDKAKSALIVGAGLIGLKCAEGIVGRVGKITVVDLAPRILSSILDEGGARVVQSHIETQGVEFKLSRSVKRFEKNTAWLDDGQELAFDILILAVGVRPNTALLKDVAQIDKGIVINGKSETTAPDIYAAGDCTQTTDVSSGQSKIMALLPNAYMQGECAGVNMAGGDESFNKALPLNAVGFFGLHIITAGNYTGDVYSEDQSAGGQIGYKRLFYGDNRLNGYILIGDVEKAGIYTSLIRERTPLDGIDFALVCEKPGLMAFTKEDRKTKLGGLV
jgi:NAD(P)H-nitrite reductase large subunit